MCRSGFLCSVLGVVLALPASALAQETATPAPEDEADVAEVEGAAAAAAPTPEAGAQLVVPPPPVAGEERMPPPPPMMATPVDGAAEADVIRLDAWLASFAGTSRTMRYVLAPLGLLVGGGAVGIGIWYITDDNLRIGSREATVGLGAAFIALGALNIGLGIYNFAAPGYPEEAHTRFQLARGEGLSARALGRFEGEFHAMAELSRTARVVSIVAGFALALGGGVAVAFSATVDREDARTIGMATGGVLAAAGALTAGLGFIPSPYERAWSKYEAGLGPDDAAPSAQISPLVGPELAGVSIAGTF